MISWLKKFFKKEVKNTTYAPKSSMKEVLEELINSGCSVREFPAKEYRCADNELFITLYNRKEYLPILAFFCDNEEVCESVFYIKEYHDGFLYKNVRVKEVEADSGTCSYNATLTYESKEECHKETSLERLKEMFSEWHILTMDEYMKYRVDLLKHGYSIEPRGKKLYLREPKEVK